jgi:hypothetical protein
MKISRPIFFLAALIVALFSLPLSQAGATTTLTISTTITYSPPAGVDDNLAGLGNGLGIALDGVHLGGSPSWQFPDFSLAPGQAITFTITSPDQYPTEPLNFWLLGDLWPVGLEFRAQPAGQAPPFNNYIFWVSKEGAAGPIWTNFPDVESSKYYPTIVGWQTVGTWEVNVSSVPLPGSAPLLFSGLIGLAGLRRFRKC